MFGFDLLALVFIPIIIRMWMKMRQGNMINNTVKLLEESGQIYFGQDSGDGGKPKMMILAAANRKGEIIDAKVIRLLRVLTPAKSFDLPEIAGKKIDDLAPSRITRDVVMRDALKNLKLNYINMRENEEPEEPGNTKRVKSKRVIKR
jgi:hypothetical protein